MHAATADMGKILIETGLNKPASRTSAEGKA
jgi:hypothetical protein